MEGVAQQPKGQDDDQNTGDITPRDASIRADPEIILMPSDVQVCSSRKHHVMYTSYTPVHAAGVYLFFLNFALKHKLYIEKTSVFV